MRQVYLNATTTPLRPQVLEALLPYVADKSGNASSLRRVGQSAKRALEEARSGVARALGAQAREIYFTNGRTESNNQAVKPQPRVAPGQMRFL